MGERDDHTDHPSAADFRFDEDRHLRVFVCRHIADGAPVLYVFHDTDDDWQFLCGQDHEADELPLVWCLEHVLARDPGLNELAGLCHNHVAERTGREAPWTITDQHEGFIERCVRDHGWAVQIIPDDDEGPGFAYTVGLHANYGHPELIIFGQPQDVMHALLNSCGDRVKSGEKLPLDRRLADILDGCDVEFREVKEPSSFKEHVGYALWFYEGSPFRLLQLVWPDKKNRFPGEPGAAAYLLTRQPLLP